MVSLPGAGTLTGAGWAIMFWTITFWAITLQCVLEIIALKNAV
jgi:hypothetical protein